MSNASNDYQDQPSVENVVPIRAHLPDPAEMEFEVSSFDPFKVFNEHGMIWLEKGQKEDDAIARSVIENLERSYGPTVINVVAFHKNMHTTVKGQARLSAFRACGEEAVEKRREAVVVKDLWYGGSKEEICGIVSNGFMRNDDINGIRFSSLHYPSHSVKSTVEDEKGMRHMLICRVLLGNTKTVPPDTKQVPCFESGVDSLFAEPGRYRIRNDRINSYVLPTMVVSFKLPGNITMETFHQIPHAKIAALLNKLSNHLLPDQMDMIGEYHRDLLVNKLSKEEFLMKTRRIAGDELVVELIKSIFAAETSGNMINISGQREAGM